MLGRWHRSLTSGIIFLASSDSCKNISESTERKGAVKTVVSFNFDFDHDFVKLLKDEQGSSTVDWAFVTSKKQATKTWVGIRVSFQSELNKLKTKPVKKKKVLWFGNTTPVPGKVSPVKLHRVYIHVIISCHPLVIKEIVALISLSCTYFYLRQGGHVFFQHWFIFPISISKGCD